MTADLAASVRTFAPDTFTVDELVEAKAGRRISLIFPCRDEAATIGPLVTTARRHLVEDSGLVDEVVVLDDGSTDGTDAVAGDAGARVVPIETIHAVHGPGRGKGNALWASLLASDSDIVVWCDGDVTSFSWHWVERLVGPLLADPSVTLVKAMYERPTHLGGGGRTTELVARPLLSMFAPALAGLHQPLSGEFAGTRAALEAIPFVQGWGVEIAMLLDLAARFGADSIGQVDLGVRHHRHRSLEALSVQAAEVMATALGRVDPANRQTSPTLRRADGSLVHLNVDERPPAADVRSA